MSAQRHTTTATYPEQRAAQQVWRLFQAGQSDTRRCEAFFEGIAYYGQTLRADAVVSALLGLWQAAPHTPLPARERQLLTQWAAEYCTADPTPAAAQLALFAPPPPVAVLDPRTLTASQSSANSPKSSQTSEAAPPLAAPAASASAVPPIARAARHTWPVNLTVYANSQTAITVAEWGLELFRQTAARHHYPTDGNAIVTVVRRVDTEQPWGEANVRLADRAEAFINDLPYTELHWYFHLRDLPLPEQYTPAISRDETEDDDLTTGWDQIYTIDCEDSRADQLAAGDLVEVTATSREAGFKIPVAVTRALWDIIEDIPPTHSYQSVNGRLWDLVAMAGLAARKNLAASVVHFKLIMHHENHVYLNVAMHIGPGDDDAPVITLMLAAEE